MKINSIQLNYKNYSIKPQKTSLTDVNQSYKNVSFQGIARVLNIKTVDQFLKQVKIAGKTTIFKRHWNAQGCHLKPITVSVVRRVYEESPPATIFGLFLEGFEKSKTLKELNSKELGIIDVSSKNTGNLEIIDEKSYLENLSCINLKKVLPEQFLFMNYLISLEGDKYSGIGTQLLKTAIQESQRLGFKGNVAFYCQNYIPDEYLKKSAYVKAMKGIAPTEFHYKFGFASAPEVDAIAKKQINNEQLNQGFYMYLPNDRRQELLLELKKTPILR